MLKKVTWLHYKANEVEMTNSLIISLAFLKVNCDSNRNGYLDNFLPLVVECLRSSSEKVISKNNLQKSLYDKFGLQIPLHVISLLLSKAKKRDYVFVTDHVYYRNDKNLSNLSFQETQSKVQRIYSALIHDFCGFTKEKYNRDILESDAERIILSFISFNQVKIFQSENNLRIIPDYPQLSQDEKIIVADYITSAQMNNPQIYDYIETIVKGYMLVNALYMPDSNSLDMKFQKTKIFFDTSFIIYALGYSGEEMSQPCLELLDLLYSSGAQLYCFRHTLDEIIGILNACSEKLGKNSDSLFGRSLQYFISHGYTPSDILLLISSLERKVENLRIHIVEKPGYEQYQYVINETKLTDLLKTQYSFPKEMAINRDVESISSIYRLRKGVLNNRIEECKAIFVTTNNTFANVVNDFHDLEYDSSSISPCVTDFALTNLMWLKTPTKAPNLPMKRLIADCYASVQPDDSLMGKWINEIEKLEKQGSISVEDYYFMRYSDESHKALVEYTLGDPEVISEGSIPEILQRAKHIITEELERSLAQSQSDLLAQKKNNDETEKKSAAIALSNTIKERERFDRIKTRANKFAKILMICFRVISFVILLIGLLISTPFEILNVEGFSSFFDKFPSFILPALFIIMLILNVVNLFWGVSVNSWVNSMEISLSKKIYDLLISISE